MKSRLRIVSGLAALAALFLAPLADASLTRASTAERAIEAPTLTLASPAAAPEPSEFSLFDGTEIARAAAESESAPSFHPLAAVSLLSKNGAEAPLVSVDELNYPKTRYRVFGFLGTPILGVERDVSLDLHWGCADFRYGFASGTVGWLSQDPLGDKDSVNLYGFVGGRPHERTDPLGLAATCPIGLSLVQGPIPQRPYCKDAAGNAQPAIDQEAELADAIHRNPCVLNPCMSGIRREIDPSNGWSIGPVYEAPTREEMRDELAQNLALIAAEVLTRGQVPPSVRGRSVRRGQPPVPSELRKYRRTTPSDQIRESVNAPAVKVDAAYGTVVEKVEAGHLISYDEIVRDPRFVRLTDSQRRQILNLPENFVPLSRGSNASQGNRVPSDWPGHSQLGPLPSANRQELERLEMLARQALEGAFVRMLGEK
jgi:RHS repeat-associated protein